MEEYDWSSEVPTELGAVPFDVVLGTDVAYYEHLYAPFIKVYWVYPQSFALFLQK